MKRCPTCDRTYTDESLNFCLDDGEWLVEATVADEAPTAILSGDAAGSDLQSKTDGGMSNARRGTSSDKLATKASRRFRPAIWIPVVLIAAGLAAFGIYKLIPGKVKVSSLQTKKMTRLTTNGRAASATISPDGRYVAYSELDESGQSSLWVRYLATSSNVQIVPPAGIEVNIGQTTFSPDGNYIYYTRLERNIPAAL